MPDPNVKHQITISVLQNGQLQIAGPFNDPIVMFGLLGLATNTVGEQIRASQGKVQVVKPGDVPNLKLDS